MDKWPNYLIKSHIRNILIHSQASYCDQYLAGLLSGHYALQHCYNSLWLNFCIQTPLYNLHAMLTVTHYAQAIIRKSHWHIHPVIRSVYCYCIVITFQQVVITPFRSCPSYLNLLLNWLCWSVPPPGSAHLFDGTFQWSKHFKLESSTTESNMPQNERNEEGEKKVGRARERIW